MTSTAFTTSTSTPRLSSSDLFPITSRTESTISPRSVIQGRRPTVALAANRYPRIIYLLLSFVDNQYRSYGSLLHVYIFQQGHAAQPSLSSSNNTQSEGVRSFIACYRSSTSVTPFLWPPSQRYATLRAAAVAVPAAPDSSAPSSTRSHDTLPKPPLALSASGSPLPDALPGSA